MRQDCSAEDLLRALKAVAAGFEPGELAWLALTSKAEAQIRDRLGWQLTKAGFDVAREWRERCDLAVLDASGEPLAVLEAKATYTHDTTWSMERGKLRGLQEAVGGETALEALVRWDAAKASRISGGGRGYVLLIAMHRHDRVPAELIQVISEGNRSPRDQATAHSQLAGYLRPLGTVAPEITLADGEAFGIRMTVTAWLCGPIRTLDLWAPRPTGGAVQAEVDAG